MRFGFLLLFLHTVTSLPYANIPNLIQLSTSNFEESVSYGSWLVIFFRGSCGHCISYSAPFSQFMKSAENWSWAVRFGAVDGESGENIALFKNYTVDKVPTLIYFKNKGISTNGTYIEAERNISLLREAVALQLGADGSLLANYRHQRQEIEIVSSSKLHAYLLVLDYTLSLKAQLKPIIVEDSNVMIVRHPNGSKIAEGSYMELRNELDKWAAIKSLIATSSTSMVTPSVNYSRMEPVYASDIFRSLSMVLYSDVRARDVITGEELWALEEFINVLYKFLPCSRSYRNYLEKLLIWLSNVKRITGEEWHNHLITIQFPLFVGPFIGCKGSQPHYRGYPCGLWTLFHALTVHEYLDTPFAKDSVTALVPHAMHRFIPRFFSCTVCAFHFAQNTVNIALPNESILPQNRAKPAASEFTFNQSLVATLPPAPHNVQEAVLWLSAVHNRVNTRLAGAPSEDPTAPKVLFPPMRYCADCWTKQETGSFVLAETELSRAFLLQFLVNRYNSGSWDYKSMTKEFVPLDSRDFIMLQPGPELFTICVVSVILTLIAACIVLISFRVVCRRHRKRGRTHHNHSQTA